MTRHDAYMFSAYLVILAFGAALMAVGVAQHYLVDVLGGVIQTLTGAVAFGLRMHRLANRV